jgi:hypothetical protein
MTSKQRTQKSSKVQNMSDETSKIAAPVAKEEISGMRALAGKVISKKIDFMGVRITINKLSVAQVFEVQARVKELEENAKEAKETNADADDTSGVELLRFVIKMAVPDAADITDEEFEGYPLDELSTLSDQIMKYSGMAAKAGNAG